MFQNNIYICDESWPALAHWYTQRLLHPSYDAAPILGLGPATKEPLPKPRPGQAVIRVGAWSLQDLHACPTVVRRKLMWDPAEKHGHLWDSARLTPGVYRVRVPVTGSSNKPFAEQRKLLRSREKVIPVALAATVLLCHLLETGVDLLRGAWTRCADAECCGSVFTEKSRATLHFAFNDRLSLFCDHHDDEPCEYVGLSAAQKC